MAGAAGGERYCIGQYRICKKIGRGVEGKGGRSKVLAWRVPHTSTKLVLTSATYLEEEPPSH